MPGDFWSTQSCPLRIGPRPDPGYGDCLLIVKFARRRPLAPHGTASAILPMARSTIPAVSHDLLDLRSMGNSHIPQRPVVVSANAATACLISRSRRHFAHRLAMARQIMASQPGWTNRYRSTSRAECAKPSLVDGIRFPNAVRSIASSRSNTVISARAEDETSEIDFRRSRPESSWGRRAPTSLVIAVTAVVANPCNEAP